MSRSEPPETHPPPSTWRFSSRTAAHADCRPGAEGGLIEPKSRFGAPTGVSSKILREVAIEHGNATTWEHVDEVRNWIAEQDASRVRTQLDRYGVTLLQGKGTLAGTDPATGNTRVIILDREGESREILTRATILSTGSGRVVYRVSL